VADPGVMPGDGPVGIVLDCSVVVDLLGSAEAPELLARVPADAAWHAPVLLATEVVSATRGLMLGGRVSSDRARAMVAAFDDLGITLWSPDRAQSLRALDLAENLTAYDATYVVLAEGLDLPLVTRDRRLAAAVGGRVQVLSV